MPEVLAAGTAACSAGGEVQRCFSVLSRTVALCEIHHAVGDAFSLTHAHHVPLQEFPAAKSFAGKAWNLGGELGRM